MTSLGKAFVLRKRIQAAILKVGLTLNNYKATEQVFEKVDTCRVKNNKCTFTTLIATYHNLSKAERALSEIISQCNVIEVDGKTPNLCIYRLAEIQKEIRLWNSLFYKIKDFEPEKIEYDPNLLDVSVNPPIKGKYVTKYYAVDESFNTFDIEQVVEGLVKEKESLEDTLAELNAIIKIDELASKYEVGGKTLLEYISGI